MHTTEPKPPPADHELLNAFTDPNITTKYIVQHFGISLRELEQWMDRPDIQEALARLERINASRARVIATEHIAWAVGTLVNLGGGVKVGDQLPRPETARKAANTILHLAQVIRGPSTNRNRKLNRAANPPPSALSAPPAVNTSERARAIPIPSSTPARILQSRCGAAPAAPRATPSTAHTTVPGADAGGFGDPPLRPRNPPYLHGENSSALPAFHAAAAAGGG